jgi:predicted kinase
VILVTGEPGSGKSVLAGDLSRALRIPMIARDDVRGGQFFSRGAWSDRPGPAPSAEGAVEATLRGVEGLARSGVSVVLEYVVRRSRPQDLERIDRVADRVVIVTECTEARARLMRRLLDDRLLNRPAVLAALGYATIEDHVRDAAARAEVVRAEMQTVFDGPTLRVATDDGYAPCLEAILEFVTT